MHVSCGSLRQEQNTLAATNLMLASSRASVIARARRRGIPAQPPTTGVVSWWKADWAREPANGVAWEARTGRWRSSGAVVARDDGTVNQVLRCSRAERSALGVSTRRASHDSKTGIDMCPCTRGIFVDAADRLRRQRRVAGRAGRPPIKRGARAIQALPGLVSRMPGALGWRLALPALPCTPWLLEAILTGLSLHLELSQSSPLFDTAGAYHLTAAPALFDTCSFAVQQQLLRRMRPRKLQWRASIEQAEAPPSEPLAS